MAINYSLETYIGNEKWIQLPGGSFVVRHMYHNNGIIYLKCDRCGSKSGVCSKNTQRRSSITGTNMFLFLKQLSILYKTYGRICDI